MTNAYLKILCMLQSLKGTDEKGQTLVEYALILVLVSIAVIGLLTALGTEVGTVFQTVTSKLAPAAAPAGP